MEVVCFKLAMELYGWYVWRSYLVHGLAVLMELYSWRSYLVHGEVLLEGTKVETEFFKIH